jgi:hypothetical protein
MVDTKVLDGLLHKDLADGNMDEMDIANFLVERQEKAAAALAELKADRDNYKIQLDAESQVSNGYFQELTRLRSDLDEAMIALDDLAQSEAKYRWCHDANGEGSIEAGRTWDMMRHSGDRARELLASHPKDGEK